jgi:hypothetical protein
MAQRAKTHKVDVKRIFEKVLANLPTAPFDVIRLEPGLPDCIFARYDPEGNVLEIHLLALYFDARNHTFERDERLGYILAHEIREATTTKPTNLMVGFHNLLQNVGLPIVANSYPLDMDYSEEKTILDAQRALSDVRTDLFLIEKPVFQTGFLLAHESRHALDQSNYIQSSGYEFYSIVLSSARRAAIAMKIKTQLKLDKTATRKYKYMASKYIDFYYRRLNGTKALLNALINEESNWETVKQETEKVIEIMGQSIPQ